MDNTCLFSLHEVEEWNILKWYKKYYINLPGSTNFSIHLHIIFFCVLSFLLTYIAWQFNNTLVFSFIISVISAFIFLNTFQHIVWTFQLNAYSPGLISGIIVSGVTIFINYILLENHLVQPAYYLLLLLIIFPAIKTIKIKKEMTPEIRRVHLFFIRLEKLIKRLNVWALIKAANFDIRCWVPACLAWAMRWQAGSLFGVDLSYCLND